MAAASLPAGVTFPLESRADVQQIEEKLRDSQTKKTLVCRHTSTYSTIVELLKLFSPNGKLAGWAIYFVDVYPVFFIRPIFSSLTSGPHIAESNFQNW